MRTTMMKAFGLGLLSLAALSFAAGQQPDTKGDSMRKDDMKQDQMAKAKVLKGWVSDSECAAHGEKKCANKEHVAQGAKLVLVTDGDNKVWTVANSEMLAEHQGHHVQVKASTDMEKGTVRVEEVKMLK